MVVDRKVVDRNPPDTLKHTHKHRHTHTHTHTHTLAHTVVEDNWITVGGDIELG